MCLPSLLFARIESCLVLTPHVLHNIKNKVWEAFRYIKLKSSRYEKNASIESMQALCSFFEVMACLTSFSWRRTKSCSYSIDIFWLLIVHTVSSCFCFKVRLFHNFISNGIKSGRLIRTLQWHTKMIV